ncbi:MAG: thiamine pyrophosphate-dependent enzyme [Anaerotardibacter sp.]
MKLLSGNEAIAQGAWEAGAHIGAAYPGTPSTETMETFAKLPGVYAEWCNNEKVALEVAMGASIAGARTLVTMKHVGVNVCADPLFTAAYCGVNGGLVLLAADDPGMFSSQNEQDSRYYAMASMVPMLEPADSQEALEYTKKAYDLSEKFDTPVMLRSTVRISHTKTPVECGERVEVPVKDYESNSAKYVMMPAFAKPRRKVLAQRVEMMKQWAESCEFNTIERTDSSIGIICAGSCYQHVKEACPDVNIFKLGCVWPLPENALVDFALSVDEVYVVEEASTYLSDAVASAGIVLNSFENPLPEVGEIHPEDILFALGRELPEHEETLTDVPGRPPALCAGCPHRLVFKELSRMKAIVTGDIGCYTLGGLPPLNAMDTTLDMGASVSMAHGFELALQGTKHRPVVAVIGDSTFAHSGLSSLLSTVYNKGVGTVCILDNRTTAMTGQQGNPFNGITLQNRPSNELNLPAILEALGVDNLHVVDPFDMKAVRNTLRQATTNDALDVIIFQGPCVLLTKNNNKPKYCVSEECEACGICSTLGCPAISKDEETGKAIIDEEMCVGCNQCAQYCAYAAINQKEQ